ncbi:hypothetical protein LguiA_012084 [Lonicera macranthoides]
MEMAEINEGEKVELWINWEMYCIGLDKWWPLFLVMSSAIIYVYYAMMLKVDEEDFVGHGALLQEGLFASNSLSGI